ncbi:proline dehydrogenase family protein [Halalkalibacter urbisdiaboli]|uniref:proline dehydrogenase family protein n=1 Tax=Halalkalibacter urbisdiaboli TaxID=1960589 RepID=UPI000B44BA9E|nr:proline dehydrogenase [Halalkalibacter urbisdiaboli]
MVVEKISKNFFLSLSKNKILNKGARKWGLRLGASQVVAGVTIDSVINAVRNLNERGLVCTVDHLGEFVLSKEEALESTNICIKTVEAIAATGVKCNLSVKLTQLGLDISPSFCLENMLNIVEVANKHNIFVRIDMEDFSRKQATLEILKELRKKYSNVGTVIQAYLHCAEKDVKELKGISLRLVKGAYKELEEVAFQDKREIDENYIKIIKEHLLSGSYTAIATHDHQIIDYVKAFCEQENIPRTQFEFQMLYGFRTDLQQQLADEGYTMRIYVPYGKDWYGYFMRRLAERPQNVSFALRGFLSK